MVNRALFGARLCPRTVVFLAALCALAYFPAQFLPLISDDYEQISVSRRYGALENWDDLFRDPLYRCRAVSIVLTRWLEDLFGPQPLSLNLTSLALHMVNTLGVALLGLWSKVGWKVSLPAAAYFAVAERHHEAVMWWAAVPELNVFSFSIACFLCWVLWLERQQAALYVAALAAFCLALLSKESGVAVVGAQGLSLLLVARGRVRAWALLVPFVALSIAYFLWGYEARSSHLHYNDGTFSLSANFLKTIFNSVGRLLWIWGFGAAAVLFALRRTEGLRYTLWCLAFAVAALLPYSFLAYMPRVPSRHSYMAGVAIAILIGAAFSLLQTRLTRRAMYALASVILVHNCLYLWLFKHDKYVERAEPTEALLQTLRATEGPVVVECFPYAKTVATQVATIAAGTSPDRIIFRDQSDCKSWRFIPATQAESKPTSTADEGGVLGGGQ